MNEMSISEILAVMPHRYPMLLVDRVLECDNERRIVGLKNVTVNEPFFNGHFPGDPIMPGVLQLEAMAQVGGILIMLLLGGDTNTTPYFMSIDKAKFRRVVRPGDALRIEVDILRLRATRATFSGRCLVDGHLVSEAEMLCMIVPSASQKKTEGAK